MSSFTFLRIAPAPALAAWMGHLIINIEMITEDASADSDFQTVERTQRQARLIHCDARGMPARTGLPYGRLLTGSRARVAVPDC